MDNEKRIEQLEKKVDAIYGMVRSLYRAQQNATTMSWIKWAVIAVVFVVAFSFIRPYITQVMNMYSTVLDMGDSVGEVKEGYSDLLKQIGR